MLTHKSDLIVEHVSDKLVRLKRRIDGGFKLKADWAPSGDQPQAIEKLVENLSDGLAHQTLLGVTGSGKTYTIANVIQRTQRPTMILAPNKTLAGQLYGEFKEFFPDNAVEYFVSYYDYYQPEAYVPSSDTFIEKDSAINEHIEQMRLSATKALMERKDAIIVASVSAIYGLGNPEAYFNMVLHLVKGDKLGQREIIRRLTEMQYTRNDVALARGTYRVRGEIIDIHPAESDEEAVRVELFDDEVDGISYFDPLTGEIRRRVPRAVIALIAEKLGGGEAREPDIEVALHREGEHRLAVGAHRAHHRLQFRQPDALDHDSGHRRQQRDVRVRPALILASNRRDHAGAVSSEVWPTSATQSSITRA